MRARLLTPVLCCLALALTASRARAEGKPKVPTPFVAPLVPLPADAIKRLKSGDAAQIEHALEDVRMSAKAGGAAVPTIVELLKQGLSPTLTQAAIDTLGDTESEGASEALEWYAHHRDVAVRRSAVQALARTRGAHAKTALRAALSDPDSGVRGLSATALGTIKAKDSVGDLFVALDHKIGEAAASIGQLCGATECEKLVGKLGAVPFGVMTSGLDAVLLRPASEVNDDVKLKVVGRVRELGTAEANQFFRDMQARWPKTGSQRVKQAVDQAVLATSSSPASSRSTP
jgi:HEAT repeat protein